MAESTGSYFLEYGSGLQVGWGRLRVNNLLDLLAIQIYYNDINHGLQQCRNRYSNYLNHFRQHFQEPGTLFYVGHDTDLTCVSNLLNIFWQPQIYPSHATVPGSGLKFDYDNITQMVSASYFSTDFSSTSGQLDVVPAIFSLTGKSTIFMKDLFQIIWNVIDGNCVDFNACH